MRSHGPLGAKHSASQIGHVVGAVALQRDSTCANDLPSPRLAVGEQVRPVEQGQLGNA